MHLAHFPFRGSSTACGHQLRPHRILLPARHHVNDKNITSSRAGPDIQHCPLCQPQGLHGVSCHKSRQHSKRETMCTALAAASGGTLPKVDVRLTAALAAVALLVWAIKKILDTPSRAYNPDDPNVGASYDDWEQEGILEYYWGEHIHLGYYSKEEREQGYKRKDFKLAKFDFIDEMLSWCGAQNPRRVLDVGCGIGGTSRHLAKRFSGASVEGITLSPNQVKRATELAASRGIHNASFRVMDALQMSYEDNTFDLVWACESGEHMPDKQKYVQEMTRVLKPGGTLVIATWCQREETPDKPLTEKDRKDLQFLYDEWTHPHFISKEAYGRLMQDTGCLDSVEVEDWTPQTLPTWRHSNWVGVWDPWIVVFKGPKVWYRVVREIVTIERMHRAFARGLMEYGMAKAVKKEGSPASMSSQAGKMQATRGFFD